MAILRNTVLVAVIAGLIAGLALAAIQAFTTVPLILQAEVFETAEPAAPADHDHAPGTADHAHDAAAAPAAAAPAAPAEAHEHNEDAWAPADGGERTFYSFAAAAWGSIGYALLLVVASELAGGIQTLRQGIFWGLAGFAVFILSPGLGLPPELPGMPAGELVARQVWWIGTAVATAAGLAAIVFRGTLPWIVAGLALLVLPHIIGAPQPVDHTTAVPDSLHHSFVVASTITNLIFFVVLGAAVALVRNRWFASQLDASGQLA
jgi:cobalt transporter subunit CbtA